MFIKRKNNNADKSLVLRCDTVVLNLFFLTFISSFNKNFYEKAY
jgi:hypothetical protein